MSYHMYFAFSQGLAAPMMVPKGTKDRLNEHVRQVEKTLKIKRTKFLDNPEHWNGFKLDYSHVSDKELCEIADKHNAWVRWVYEQFCEWSKTPPEDGEQITPEEAQEFWPGLTMIEVPPNRWTPEYYTARMECLYEVMRGRESEGISFDAKALTEKQAANVIRLFAEFLDRGDRRLDVPKGHDYLASSYDGGYEWCEKCGAVCPDDVAQCRRRKCPLIAERRAEDEA